MKKIILSAILLTGFSSFAYTTTAEVGLHMDHANVKGTTAKDRLNFQGGVIVGMPINDMLTFRTGGLLTMKNSEVEVFSVSVKRERLFIDVPVALQFGNEIVQGYAGVDVGVKLSSSCKVDGGSCTITDEKTVVIQPNVGVQFPVSNTMHIGFNYEFESEFEKDYKQSSYGINLGFMF